MKGIEQNAGGRLQELEGDDRFLRVRRPAILGVVVSYLAAFSFLAFSVAPTWADGENPQGLLYPPSSLDEASRNPDGFIDQLIDSKAAKELPRVDLGRDEAKELAESVFGGLLEISVGPFGDLHVEEFVSDTAAIIAPSESETGVSVGGEKAAEEEDLHVDGPLLLESTLPLRTETDSGQERVINLDLEPDEGELQPVNPLVDVGIPDELGEGIELPSASLELDASTAAQERSPSILGGNVAFYPNVAKDTDFAVAATPTGIETFAQIRSADAPQSQTLQLSLSDGATLEKTVEGGAVAMSDGEEVLRVMPPTAFDANGNSVPASLEVSGDSLVLTVSTDETTAFPVLLDPTVYDLWTWNGDKNHRGIDNGDGTGAGVWRSARNTLAYASSNYQPWQAPPEPLLTYGSPGLTLTSGYSAPVAAGAQANWNYYVPRYFTDYEQYGTRPTSFIQTAQFWNLQYLAFSSQPSPWMIGGIWDEQQGKWVSVVGRTGAEGSIGENYWYYLYEFNNPTPVQSAKNVGLALISTETGANNPRIVYVGSAMIAMNDLTKPSIGSFTGPVKWENTTAVEGIKIDASDSGLGMKSLKFVGEKAGENYPVQLSCAGTGENPCPRMWSPVWKGYPAASLSTGIHYYTVTASDVLGNESASAKVQVKIDHTAPSLTLSGTMTQQASLGYARPQYVLHLDGADGTSTSPQSGIAASEITVDGKAADVTNAGCATQNCALSRDWTLKSSSYAPGQHKVVAIVTDGAGIKTTKSLTITIEQDETAPILENVGNLRTAPDGWVEQQSYTLYATAKDGGYGLTSLIAKIDGTQVASWSGTCVNGGCNATILKGINMSAYSGGSHLAEVLATDGAGNVSKDAWTVNVNPKGTVPSSEATDTIEATEETTDSTALAPTIQVVEPAEIEAGNDPALLAEGTNFESTGTGVDSSMTVDAGSGFTIDNGEETFQIEPTQASASETNLEVANGVAGVAANTTGGVDTVIRPIYDGIMGFQSIRTSAAPEAYSWNVQLHQEQVLKVIDEQHAGIFYPDETLALAIRAEVARDATGKEVPTSLSVSEGKVLTLAVHHKSGGFVYPVTAGPTWQTGYETIVVKAPPTKQEEEEREAEEELKAAERSVKNSVIRVEVGAPEVVGKGDEYDASASSVSTYRKRFSFEHCSEQFLVIPECSEWGQKINGHFHYNNRYAWWKNNQSHPVCPHSSDPAHSVSTYFCDFVGPNHQKYGGGYHISAQVFFDVSFALKGGPLTWGHQSTVRAFGSGGVYFHPDNGCICNPSV